MAAEQALLRQWSSYEGTRTAHTDMMNRKRRCAVQILSAMLVVVLTVSVSGCAGFFVCAKSSCTTSGSSSSSTVNYAYTGNSTSGSTYIGGYALSSGSLVALTGFPFSLTYTPTAMAVSRNNSFLFVGSSVQVSNGQTAIYRYNIGTGGALSGGTSLIQANDIAAMTVSADGQWLIVLTVANYSLNSPLEIAVFSINSSTGNLALVGQPTLLVAGTGIVITPSAIAVAPSGQYVAVALGTAGIATYSFNTSTGALGTQNPITFTSATTGAYDVSIDSNNYLYAATTGDLLAFTVSNTGLPTTAAISTKAVGATGPFSVAVAGTSYVYGGAGGSTVYGFTNAGGGVLNAFTTPTTSGPGTLTKLAVDSSGKYLLAQGQGTGGLAMYTIGTGGTLGQTSSVATGTVTAPANALALTH